MIASKSKYKQTGLKWITEIPEHWELKRLGGLFEERNETVSENDYAPLSVTMKGIVPQLESAAKTMHVDNRKKVCVGDFAINSRSDRRGSGGLSNLEGSVSIVNTVLKPSKFYVPEYTHYLLTNKLFQDEYYAKGKGIVADMWSTRFSEMKTIYLPVPPKDEQDEIVQYIKAKEEKINLFIQKKQRFIELLKEQRQSVVDNSITKNIAACKDIRLKYISGRIGDGLHGTPQYVDYSEFKFINGNNLINGTIVTSDETNCVTEEEFNKYNLKLKKGTILYSINGTIGNMAFYDGEPVVLGKSAAYIEPDEISKGVIDYDYLFHYLQTNRVMKYFLNATASTTIKNLSLFTLRNTPVLVPHTIEQQKKIVSHIKTETATIDTAIAKAEWEIELIREYKEAMIAEAVMGTNKINKR